MNTEKRKILFINFGGLGDEILFLPTIISVKREFPNSEITLALEPRGKCIVQLTDIIDETLCANIKIGNKYFSLLKLLLKIWTKKFDIVISSGSNKFISLFLFFTFIKQRYGYDTGKLSQLVLTKAIQLNKNQYASAMYHDLVSDLTSIKTPLAELNISKRSIEPNTVLIHPGVSLMSINKGIVKTISADVWAETIEKLANLGKKVILAGGPDDETTIKTIVNSVPKEKFTNMYGKTKNLRELATLIAGTEVFLCSDSAPLHIATALGVKTYVIFGSTDDKKLIPVNHSIIPIKAKDCKCPIQPCLWEKRQTTCKTLDCLKITSDDIVGAIIN